jgi:hypothetical protein
VSELESGTRELFRDHALTGEDRVARHLAKDQLERERRDRKEGRPMQHPAERPSEFTIPDWFRPYDVHGARHR